MEMTTATTNPREERGRQIARNGKIKPCGGTRYNVASQTEFDGKGYLVDLAREQCTCPDHDLRKVRCKHIFAVTFWVKWREDGTVGEAAVVVERKTYAQDWPAYHRAQVHEKEVFETLLAELCNGIVQPPRKPGAGRNPVVLRDAVFGLVHKVYTTFSGRRAQTDFRRCAERGLISTAPSYNTLFRCMENPAVTPILKCLVEESAAPLAAIERGQFAIDSTGFSTVVYERWFDQKHGKLRSEHVWVKLHAFIGTLTNVVASVEVSQAADCPMLPSLLNSASRRFAVNELSADKAYSSLKNVEAIYRMGAVPLIPFKENATGAGRSELWRKAWAYFTLHLGEFLPRYHRRSNVETTFAMVKAKLGSVVRSKLPTAMVNECLAKIVCHNIMCVTQSMFEFNVAPEFWKPVSSSSTVTMVQP